MSPVPDIQTSFKELLHDVNLIGVMINPAAEITYCNEYFLRLTGWSFAEIEGRNWHEVFVPPSIEDLKGLIADLFKDKPATWFHENDILTRSGERRCIRWNNILLRDTAGTAIGAAGIGEDITDRKKIERALLDSNARERRDLESDLHDGLGQELFGIALLARGLATRASRDKLAIADDLVRLSNVASTAIESCRRIARAVSPLSDLQGGLVQALKQLTIRPANWSGPSLEFSVKQDAPLVLSAEAADHVYRLAQEGLSNALKHARAHSIKMALAVQQTSLVLEILDDGVGMTPAAVSSGLGLKAMYYRAGLLNANLSVGPQNTSGTRLLLTCGQPA